MVDEKILADEHLAQYGLACQTSNAHNRCLVVNSYLDESKEPMIVCCCNYLHEEKQNEYGFTEFKCLASSLVDRLEENIETKISKYKNS